MRAMLVSLTLIVGWTKICGAQSLNELGDGSYKLDITKQSSMASKSFQTHSASLSNKKFKTEKTFHTFPYAVRTVAFDKTATLGGNSISLKTSSLADKSSPLANKTLSSAFSESSSMSKSFPVIANSEFNFLQPSGFDKSFAVKPYTGRLPIAVNESFTERQRKELTPEQVRDLINRNK